jgi:hypothetical protein
MEFLVHLSHDEEGQSYDLHHMFLHSLSCAFGTGFWSDWLTHRKRSCGLIAQFCTVKDD